MNRDAHGMAQPTSATAEATYQGPAGATRAQAVHLPLVDGTWRTVSVYFGVNVQTDPHLRDAVFSGALHRVDAGAPLAVPFVYHDPARQKLALVVPEELRHRALLERSRLLSELADEAGVPVPGYAAEATIVIGLPHLAAYLEAASTHALRLQDEAELLEKRKELGAHEQSLLGREEAARELFNEVLELQPRHAEATGELRAMEILLEQEAGTA